MAIVKHGPTKIPGFVRQLLCGLVLSSAYLNVTIAIVWPNILPKIVNDPELTFNLTTIDIQWITSANQFGAAFSSCLTGVLMELLGPRRLLNWCMVPAIVLWVVMAYVPSKTALYVARFGNGIVNGISSTASPPLLAELSSPEIRGTLGSIRLMLGRIGTLAMCISAAFLPWKLATVLSAIPLVPVFILLFFVPESPYWLTRKGRDGESLKALTLLRGPEGDARSELDRIKRANEEQPSISLSDQLHRMKEPNNYKPVALSAFLGFIQPTAGHGFIFPYTLFIFQMTETNLDPFICIILVSVTCLLSTIVTVFIVEFIDRRPLVIGSALVCAFSFIMTSVVMLMPLFPRWLILVFILLYTFSLCNGVSLTSSLVVSELVPTPVRSLGTSFCSGITLFGFFVSSFTFPLLINEIGIETALFFFAGINLFLALLFWGLVPETRGRSLVDLQNVFLNPNKKIHVREA